MNKINLLSRYRFTCDGCGKMVTVTVINKEHPKRVNPPKGWRQRVNSKSMMHETTCPDCS